jgi:hypothetical protein
VLQTPDKSRVSDNLDWNLDWLQGACADISILGQDRRKGHAVTLSHVYVPALTRAEPKPKEPKRNRKKQVKDAEEQKPIRLIGRMDRESLYVPAPAGAGKSTFCRRASTTASGVSTCNPTSTSSSFASTAAAPATLPSVRSSALAPEQHSSPTRC